MKNHHFSILSVLITAAFYIPTVQKGLPGGDSGELMSEACQLGVAHPPGYPLFILMFNLIFKSGKHFSMFGEFSSNAAFRMNFGAAVTTCLTSGILTAAISHFLSFSFKNMSKTKIGIIALLSSLSFIFAPLTWLYSVAAEVFFLNNFFVAFILFLLLKYIEACDYANSKFQPVVSDSKLHGEKLIEANRPSNMAHIRQLTNLTAFVCGLSLCNQHTSLFLIIPVALFMGLSQLKYLSPRDLFSSVFSGLLGLSPYLYLPYSQISGRVAGSWGDVTTFRGFFHHFLRADYGTFKLLSSNGNNGSMGLVDRTIVYFEDIYHNQMAAPIFVFFIIGLLTALVRVLLPSRTMKLPFAAALRFVPLLPTVLLMFYLLVFHSLSNMPMDDPLLFGIHQRFWMQPTIVYVFIVGYGVAFATSLIDSRSECVAVEGKSSNATKPISSKKGNVNAVNSNKDVPGLACIVRASLPIVIFALFLLNSTRTSFFHFSRITRNNEVLNRYGRAMLTNLPINATLITSYDFQWTSTRYLQTCEGVRKDVTILNAPSMSYRWFQSHRSSYPHLAFPGDYLLSSGEDSSGKSVEKNGLRGFSWREFFLANSLSDCGAALVADVHTVEGQQRARDIEHQLSESLKRKSQKAFSRAQGFSEPLISQEQLQQLLIRHPVVLGGENRGETCRLTQAADIFMSGGFNIPKSAAMIFETVPHGLTQRIRLKSQALLPFYGDFCEGGVPLLSHLQLLPTEEKVMLSIREVSISLIAFEEALLQFNGYDDNIIVRSSAPVASWTHEDLAYAGVIRSTSTEGNISVEKNSNLFLQSPDAIVENLMKRVGPAAAIPSIRTAVNPSLFRADTWERATIIDFSAQAKVFGTFLLEWALSEPSQEVLSVAARAVAPATAANAFKNLIHSELSEIFNFHGSWKVCSSSYSVSNTELGKEHTRHLQYTLALTPLRELLSRGIEIAAFQAKSDSNTESGNSKDEDVLLNVEGVIEAARVLEEARDMLRRTDILRTRWDADFYGFSNVLGTVPIANAELKGVFESYTATEDEFRWFNDPWVSSYPLTLYNVNQNVEFNISTIENPLAAARLTPAPYRSTDMSLLKNIGLAYMRLVRSSRSIPSWRFLCDSLPYIRNVKRGSVRNQEHSSYLDEGNPFFSSEDEFRLSAADAVLRAWSAFIKFPEAKSDPSFPTISHVVKVLSGALDAGKSDSHHHSTYSKGMENEGEKRSGRIIRD